MHVIVASSVSVLVSVYCNFCGNDIAFSCRIECGWLNAQCLYSLSLSGRYTHTNTHTSSSWPNIAAPQCIVGSAGCLSVNCELSVSLSQLNLWLAYHQASAIFNHFSEELLLDCFVVLAKMPPTHGLWDIIVSLLYFSSCLAANTTSLHSVAWTYSV